MFPLKYPDNLAVPAIEDHEAKLSTDVWTEISLDSKSLNFISEWVPCAKKIRLEQAYVNWTCEKNFRSMKPKKVSGGCFLLFSVGGTFFQIFLLFPTSTRAAEETTATDTSDVSLSAVWFVCLFVTSEGGVSVSEWVHACEREKVVCSEDCPWVSVGFFDACVCLKRGRENCNRAVKLTWGKIGWKGKERRGMAPNQKASYTDWSPGHSILWLTSQVNARILIRSAKKFLVNQF